MTTSGSIVVTRTITGPNWPSMSALTPLAASVEGRLGDLRVDDLVAADQAEVDGCRGQAPFGQDLLEGLAAGKRRGSLLSLGAPIEDDLLHLPPLGRGEARGDDAVVDVLRIGVGDRAAVGEIGRASGS